MFKERTFKNIRASILSRLDDDLNKDEGSFTSDIIAAVALEIVKMYAYMNTLLSAMFPNENSGEYLVKRCADFGITRKAATAAEGEINVIAAQETTIPEGTRLTASDTGLSFATTRSANVPANLKAIPIPIRALQAGRIRVSTNSLKFDPPLASISTITNPEINDGTDTETDESLYQRLKLRLSNPPAAGTAYDYKRWALEVPGVGLVKVRFTDGIIKVIVASEEGKNVSETVLNNATSHIEAKRPLGTVVEVKSTLNQLVIISASVKLSSGYSLQTVKSAFENAMAEHILSIAFDDESDTLTLAMVTHILMSIPGVQDATLVKINGLQQNWDFNSNAIPTPQIALEKVDVGKSE
ncbi:MAG: baseplate J/gp47 family protein [Christensenellaceae bacterium]|nr:baseplate J/gp47 family protein [Christensenellaceae bacterium]